VGRLSEEPKRVGVSDALDDDPRQSVHHAGALEEGLAEGERCDVARIVFEMGKLIEHCDDASARRGSGVGPTASERRGVQQVECEIGVTGVSRPLGDRAQFEHATGVAWHAVVEDLAQPFHACPIEVGQREL
jgi:hypothetical protein